MAGASNKSTDGGPFIEAPLSNTESYFSDVTIPSIKE